MVKIQKVSVQWLILVQWILAFEWLKSGLGKFTKPDFMEGIEGSIGAFSSKTPYGFYSSFLKSVDARLLGNLTRWSEILIGLALALGGLYVLKQTRLNRWLLIGLIAALFGGALLNLNFYLAAAWSSPSTESINIVMGLTHLVLGAFFVNVLRKQ